jgi:preprotein translocase subunit SecA
VPAAFAFEGVGRRLVLALKYANARGVARAVAAEMVRHVPPGSVDAVTWAPTSASRRRHRGYDQAELLARAVARRLGVPCRRLLDRVSGPAQTGRTRGERLLGPSFRVRRRPPGRVLVVDDVVTTGATLAAAERALRSAGAREVRCIAAAATPARGCQSTAELARPPPAPGPGQAGVGSMANRMGILDRILRAGEGKKLKALAGLVPDVNALEAQTRALSDDALKGKTPEFRERLERGEDLDDLLVEAFAVVREAATRVIGQRHYDVQLMGGAALHFGWIAEMKTGEGKTLVSTLPAYLNGLSGRGMHIVTVNDYLARRDAEWMGRIHRWLGLDVGLIIPGVQESPAEKRRNYAADITYGTNNEFGFDYLRDNMAVRKQDKVQRGHVYAIVDEVDSILIDEARTPLIISGRVADAAKLYYRFASIARSLHRDDDYEVDEEKRTVFPTEEGIEKVERALGVDNLYDEIQQNLVHQLQAALRAKELYKRDKEYIVQNGEVKIVDEFTGRILEGRRWSEGLHQAVEAKEGVRIKEENQTLATITLQNYFRMYEKLAGMTGTAQTEAAELMNTYGLQVVPIPTNKAVVRVDEADQIYKSEDAKFGAVVEDIVERSEIGQPVLVGTISVEKSEKLSKMLRNRGVDHEVLNAKQHTREAGIVAQAGRPRAVTVATNMAGRGVDILLGGNPEGLARQEVLREGHAPDTLLDEFALPMPLAQMPEEFREARAAAQARYAELLAEFKETCKADGETVRELGGLYVLATERHESRRIDNQLRGRSGRQGDPGASRFYLSLDDELMRLFATGALQWVMGRALPDDTPIEAKMVTKAIERAQSTVETRNAEIRKNVLKYDEVMNEQRKVIYKRRDQILEGADLRAEALEYLEDAVDTTVGAHCVSDVEEEWDLDSLVEELRTLYPATVTPSDLAEQGSIDGIRARVMDEIREFYERREQEITPDVMREVERQVMLRIIDQRWREHLYEMDYLQEGINLRAMGQKDPLVEWQREGFDMFGQLMHGIANDFARYVTHVKVEVRQPDQAAGQVVGQTVGDGGEQAAAAPRQLAPIGTLEQVQNLQTHSSDDAPVDGMKAAAAVGPASDVEGDGDGAPAAPAAAPAVARGGRRPQGAAPVQKQQTVVKDKDDWANTPRNAPCPCGSGKKYKMCHGR